jgi:C1A family cysteine protease
MAAFESACSQKYGSGKKQKFSEQQPTDCAYSRSGCNGGWPTAVWNYNKGKKPTVLLSDYAYTARYAGSCKDGGKKYQKKPSGWTGGINTVSKTWDYLDKGVLSSALGVDKSFSNYKTGIFDGTCASLNHAVNLVGKGKEGGVEYFRLKNSWGTWWGDKGYMKIIKNSGGSTGKCQIAQYNYLPYCA